MRVFLHGFMGDPFVWNPLRTQGSFAPALVGHDALAKTESVASFEDEVARLSRLIQANRQGRVHLIGYSLGARVALGIAASIPVDRLTLISGRDGLSNEAERAQRAQQDEAWAARLDACDDEQSFAEFLVQWDAQPVFQTRTKPTSPDLARRLAHDPHRLAAALRALSLARMPVYAPHVRCAWIDVIAAAQDDKFRALAEPLAASLHAKLTMIPNAGHDLPREAPSALALLLNGDEDDEFACSHGSTRHRT